MLTTSPGMSEVVGSTPDPRRLLWIFPWPPVFPIHIRINVTWFREFGWHKCPRGGDDDDDDDTMMMMTSHFR